MALAHLGGLDHVVVLVDDLAAAAETWRELGFTISPRGIHSTHKGTGNHTIMLGEDYVELLGILRETPLNALDRAGLAEVGEGIDRAAFRTSDARATAVALREAGIQAGEPQSFGRPVELPDGRTADAAFQTFDWPAEASPGGLRLFACQHLTPDAVWVPELQRHANGARAMRRLEILSDDPEQDAAEMARLIGRDPLPCPDEAWRVPSAPDRADFVFLDPSLLAARYPGVPLVECRPAGAAALVLATGNLSVAAALPGALRTGEDRVAVPPDRASGVLLVFEER